MKKTIIRIMQVTFAIAAFALAIYLEDYVSRGFGMFVGMVLAIIGLAIGDKERWRDFIATLGALLYFGFFVGTAMTLHIEKTKNGGVLMRSAFYTRILERGSHVDTLQLHPYYEQYYSKIEVAKKPFFFVYKQDSCSVYNEYEKIATIPLSFTIKNEDFGSGNLDYIEFDNKRLDLRGRLIDSEYQAEIKDITPDFSINSNL